MSYNFLDKTGLTYLWGKIKAYIGNKTIPLINGTQTASTSAWTGVAPFSTLEDGQVINYYLPYASTSTAVTLNLTLSDGTTTGALPVYFNNGTERMTTHFGRGGSMSLMYKASRVNSSGTTITNSWYFFSNRDTNTINQIRLENGGLYAGTNGIKKYSLCALDKDGKYQSFTTTSGTDTSKTINTSAKFIHPMTIYQNNANADYANDAVTGKYQIYNAVRADLRYSCNNFNNFVINKPLYLECTKDADGFLSVTSNVMVQSGFVGGNYYVYLGEICNDAKYMLQLVPQHPTFYYTGQHFIDVAEWKVDKVDGMGLSECNYTTTDRNKLSGIEDNATRVIVDSAFSNSSTNAIQNKLVYSTFQSFANNVDNNFAKLASPTFTGTPKAPTATAGTNTTQIATTAFVQTAVSGKQNTLATQTAYTSKGSATKVPQITTNTLGQVTGITEVSITQPTVNNGTLTIQKNGTNVQTFTANQSNNVTANISVPTATSDLTNDSNFTTQSALLSSDAFKQAIVELIYPVGSLYITNLDDDDHNPNNLFPGTTWIRTCIGRALTGALDSEYTSPIPNSINTFGALGWNSNWSTAFQNDVRSGQYVHTLTTTEMPAHTHSTYIGGTNGSGYVGVNGSAVATKAMNTATSSAGGGSAHPIMQAYETYMIWRRDT